MTNTNSLISLEFPSESSIFSPSPSKSEITPSSSAPFTTAEVMVKMLKDLGVSFAFGVSGGGIAPLWVALERSSLHVLHFRHEAGATFAAVESYFVNGRPVVVFTTTGPGITNALTGLLAARWEGAKVILLSAFTAASKRGRWACQETSVYTMPITGIFTPGALFNYAVIPESNDDLVEIQKRLAIGLSQPGGFVAHLSFPIVIQTSVVNTLLPVVTPSQTLVTVNEEKIMQCAQLLAEAPFAIWIGFGARNAAKEIRALAERTGAAVMCSPRGKGIFPEDHPQFVGVTGVGGHKSVLTYMQEQRPLRILVLGTRLGEATSFWNPTMIPSRGFLHVDIDPEVPGVAYPSAETLAIQSDVGEFVKTLLKLLKKKQGFFFKQDGLTELMQSERASISLDSHMDGLVRPEALLNAIQRVIVEGSDAIVMAESGNSLAWGNHVLRFTKPGRYRVSTGFGSMGHFVTGVVGAALAHNGKTVAIVGDGAMLMNSEVSTAVKYRIPAVWIVLNDASYNMCHQGMELQGYKGIDTEIPQADFVMIARGMGADGVRVERESEIQAALEKAIFSPVPFVVDVIIDATQPAPIAGRIQNLISEGAIESKRDLS